MVVADVDGATLRMSGRPPLPAWLASKQPGEPLSIRVPRDALRPLSGR